MALNPSFRRPNVVPAGVAHESVRSAIFSHDQSITDLNQAIAVQAGQISALKSPSTSTSSGTSTTTQVSTENVTNNTTISGGVVNNQTGNITYTTAQGDNGALIILADTSPVAVTLNNAVTLPWYCFITNQAAGLVTLTPQQNLIDGNATQTLQQGYFLTLFFDGTNFWSGTIPIVPVNTPGIAHEWIDSYDATTGVFTLSQPAFTDISGVAATTQIGTGTPSAGNYVDGGTGAWTALPPPPTVPSTIAPVAGEYLTGYNSGTGVFSQSTPAGISVTITTAALTIGGIQGSQTFTNGILTAQTPAT